jgi:hypothetical protein
MIQEAVRQSNLGGEGGSPSRLAGYTSIVYTVFVLKNITFSADPEDIDAGRDFARSQRTTLNGLFREWLRELTGRQTKAEQYRALMNELRHVNAGRKFTREEMNERR